MRRTSASSVILAVGACFILFISAAFAQTAAGGAWPTLHMDNQNSRTTSEVGPDITSQNLTVQWRNPWLYNPNAEPAPTYDPAEVGWGRSNPLIDGNGRIYVMGTISGDGPLGPHEDHLLVCLEETIEEETDCSIPSYVWSTEIPGSSSYDPATWSTGALSPTGDKLFIAALAGGLIGDVLVLDCYDTDGDPDNPGDPLLIFSIPFIGGGDSASDLIIDEADNRIYVFGNNGDNTVGYGFTYDGEIAWQYGYELMAGYDPLGDISASPVTYDTSGGMGQYTYKDPDFPGYQNLGMCKTLYAPGEDGTLYAMHTVMGTVWTEAPNPAPYAEPPDVQLKWARSLSAEPLVSSPHVIPRAWLIQEDLADGTGTDPDNPPLYNRTGTTSATVYICTQEGVIYCIEDSNWIEHDWQPGMDPEGPPWIDVKWTPGNEDYEPNQHYTSSIRWELDLGSPIAATPIISNNTLYVVDETALYAIDLTTGTDIPGGLGLTEGQVTWTASSEGPPDDEWDFTAHPDLGVAPSPVLDGNGLIWLVTSDGWLHVVCATPNPDIGLEPGEIAFHYFTADAPDTDHRGDENAPFYRPPPYYPASPVSPPVSESEPLDMVCSPIISGGFIYVRGQGIGDDPEYPRDTGWIYKIKENVVGRYRFQTVDPVYGYTENNRMGRARTAFTYDADYYDPDCGAKSTYNDPVPDPANSIILYIDGAHTGWLQELLPGFFVPYHIDPDNPNPQNESGVGETPYGTWEGMVYQIDSGDDDRRLGHYMYKSDGAISETFVPKEYIYYNQNGRYNFFCETADGFGLNAPLVSEVFPGPNMCPELYFVKTDVIFDGTIARVPKTILDLGVWYYDSDEDSPIAADHRLLYLDNVPYPMNRDMVNSNESQTWEDRYSVHLATSNDTPGFHFEFTDEPQTVYNDLTRNEAHACTSRLPEYGQLFTMTLRDTKVTPAVGAPGMFTYSARFFDPKRRNTGINTGVEGSLNANVFIDGMRYNMILKPGNGSQFDGLYTVEVEFLDYGEHSFRFDFNYEGSMPSYNDPRSNGQLTSADGTEVEQRVVIDRASAPQFEYIGPTISPWPSFNRYQDNNSLDPLELGPSIPNLTTLNIGQPIKGTPVVGGALETIQDGGTESTVYVGSRDGVVYAISTDLDQSNPIKWQYNTGDFVDCTPALGQEGSLVVASRNGYVISLDSATGEFRWLFSAANIADSSPCVGVNGNVYIGSYTGTFYSINGRRGTLNWSYDLPSGGAVQCCAAQGTGSTLYFTSYDNYVYALNSDGTLLWTHKTGGLLNSSPAVETNGNTDTLYVGCDDYNLYRLDYDFSLPGAPEPVEVWRYETGGRIAYSSPAVDDDFVYIASDALYAIDKNTGQLEWSYVPEGDIFGTVAVDAAGVVYFGSSDAKLYAVHAPVNLANIESKQGELLWWQRVGSEIWVSGTSIAPTYLDQGEDYPLADQAAYGQIFFGCWDGKLYNISNREVNIPPELTNHTLSPSIGDSSQAFRFGIHYFDANGDEPLLRNIYIDDIPYEMTFTGIGYPAAGEYEFYADFDLGKGTHTYYFEFADGNWAGSASVYLPIDAPDSQYTGPVVDNKPQLSEAGVDPQYGDFEQEFVFSVLYQDPDDDVPLSGVVVIDGVNYTLTGPSGAEETPFNGVYTFTTTGRTLGIGDHTFHFEFEYAVNEWVKIPVVGQIQDLTVNNSPLLQDNFVNPPSADASTDFTYSVHYADEDNHPPAVKNVVIDGVAHSMSLYSDFDSDGTYRYTISGDLIGYGAHIYYFDFQDTQGARVILPAPPLEPFNGPAVNAVPELTNGQVSPISGDADVDFIFSVNYGDADGIRPDEVVLVLDGNRYDMTLEQGILTDGLYARTMNGASIGLGDDHSYHFEATDDSDSQTRFPIGASGEISGPAIVEPGIYIPYWQVNRAQGLDTTLVVCNTGASQLAAAVDVNIHLYSGLLGDEIDTISHTIAAGEQVKVDFSDRFADPLSHFGCAKISWDRGSIGVWAMIQNGDAQAVSMTLKDPQIRTSYLPYWQVSSESTIDTLLAISNIGGSPVDLNLRFYNFSGSEIGATTVTIQPRALRPIYVSALVSNPESEGSAVLTWERGVLAVWGMIAGETGKAYEVAFNQPFTGNIDLPYWVRSSSGATPFRSPSAIDPNIIGRSSNAIGDTSIRSLVARTLSVDSKKDASHSMPHPVEKALPTIGGFAESRPRDVLPPVNNSTKRGSAPELFEFDWEPHLATTLDPITFYINYSDVDEDPPAEASIYIDDVKHEMSLQEGVSYDGLYSYQTFLQAALVPPHSIFFIFSDGEHTVRFPIESYYTVAVSEGTEALDTWLVVTNLTENTAPAIVSLMDQNAEIVANPQMQLAGLYRTGMMLFSESSVPQGFGSGIISLGIAEPVMSVWGIVYSETFDTGYALNLDANHSKSLYVPYWSINDEYGVHSWMAITNRGEEMGVVTVTLADSEGSFVGFETQEIHPNNMWFFDVRDALFDRSTKISGRATIIWEEGDYLLYGAISDLTNRTSYPLSFIQPKIHR
ncbi:PQQ-binding-like beta-propeller repeat protein [bacterium]|nr:PQQ-binding-like beta-propeller repeat protein [bacterium]